ncbi:hypothetical protein EZ55_01277 [Alteromonas macleodii]|nr:hypothetical protein EZ55_01277 [Alteromonas macleodii]VTP53750.1 hypothetical protein EZ55_01277 [Alteromonas macleodii]
MKLKFALFTNFDRFMLSKFKKLALHPTAYRIFITV